MEKNEVIQKIVNATWYHAYEILPGIVTPGFHEVFPQQVLEEFMVPTTLLGQKILEIGTWDGPLAFALEARGADVTASDIQDPDVTAFNTAREILQSNIRYVRSSVYELPKHVEATFDSVFMLGVLYHLKHPLLALECIHHCLKPGGLAYLEGECLLNYAEILNLEQPQGKPHPAAPQLIKDVAGADVPLTLCYPGIYKQKENWFIPNIACLKSWFSASGFDIIDLTVNRNSHPSQRFICRLQKKRGPLREHIVLRNTTDAGPPHLVIKKAMLLKSAGQYDQVVHLLTPILQLDEQNPHRISALVQLAAVYREQRHTDWQTFHSRALETLDALPVATQKDVYRKASAYQVLLEFKKAEILFHSIAQKRIFQPDSPMEVPKDHNYGEPHDHRAILWEEPPTDPRFSHEPLDSINNHFAGGTYYHLGEIFYFTQRPKEAREAFAACLHYLPWHQKALEYMNRIKEEAGF